MMWMMVLLACGMFQSDEERLAEAQIEQTKVLDELYATYGGSQFSAALEEVASEAKAAAPEEVAKAADDALAKAFMEGMAGAASEADRATFESRCLSIGRGEKPVFLTKNGRTFFARPEVITTCVGAAARAKRMETLRASLGE